MKKTVLVFVLLFASNILLSAQQLELKKYALVNGHVVDHMEEEILENTMILLAEGKIELILPNENEAPEGYDVIDLDGKFILSGFMDAHTHLSSLQAAEKALHSGVTTVRSSSVPCFQDVAIKNLVDKNYIAGPDMIPAGVFVTPDLGESVLADPELASLFEGGYFRRSPAQVGQDQCGPWCYVHQNKRYGKGRTSRHRSS